MKPNKKEEEDMVVIGITGGIGAGKSEVIAYLLQQYGAHTERLDDLAKELMEPGKANYHTYINILGEDIVTEDQSLNRPLIASRIFSDPELLKQLNHEVNPAIREELMARMEEKQKEKCELFLIESAILHQEQYNALCHETWYIYADASVRKERLITSRNYDGKRIEQTMNNQIRDEDYRKLADHVIDNSGAFEETKKQIDRRYYEILQHCKRQQR